MYFEYICWKFAGRLLDRVNTPLFVWLVLQRIAQTRRMRRWAIKSTATASADPMQWARIRFFAVWLALSPVPYKSSHTACVADRQRNAIEFCRSKSRALSDAHIGACQDWHGGQIELDTPSVRPSQSTSRLEQTERASTSADCTKR